MIPWEEFLSDREIYILQNRPGKTYKALGQELGICTERVRQIHRRALKKIQVEPIKRRLRASDRLQRVVQ